MSLADDIRELRLPRRRAAFTAANTSWSDEILADLRARYSDGDSYGQIADALNHTYALTLTRHAIAGAINRYVPEKRRATAPAQKYTAPGASAVRAARDGFMTAFGAKVAKPKPVDAVAPAAPIAVPVVDAIAPAILCEGVSLYDLRSNGCHHIAGDPRGPRPYTCTGIAAPGFSFCAAHHGAFYAGFAGARKDIRDLSRKAIA